MSDNYAINEATSGTLTTIAADEIGGIKYPRTKLCFGVDGAVADVSATNPAPVTTLAQTSGGLTPYRNLDAGSTGSVVKGAAGQIYTLVISNQHATNARYLKVYNKASAASSADTPVMTIPVQAGQTRDVTFPNGLEFNAGISIRATTGIADADTGAPSPNDVVVNIGYK